MSNYVGKSNIIDALKRYLVNLKSLFATKTELSGKADKATGFTTNNLAKLDANGNPVDSGKKASDFASATVVVSIANSIASILDGNTVVGKAKKDQNGNVIDTTYATKTENSAKADKVTGATSGDIATLDANGNLTDGGKKISDFATTTSVASKADKVSGATAGNIAKLDANGNLADGGIDASSLMAKRGNFVNNGLLMYSNGDMVDSGKTPDDIWLKADRDTDAVTGNLAKFDSNGNPIDSGKSLSDLATKTSVDNILDGISVAKKAEKDKDGNDITTTYATKAEMTTADNNLQAQIDELMGRKVFGIHINGALSDPDSMVTYLEDAVGMTPAHMDFANDVFDYGSWENAFFVPKPCMLKYDGTVDYYLDPNDYTKKIDGTASDVSDDTYAGNAMMEWPKIWLKMVPDTDPKSASVYISNYKADDDFHCWSNINSKGAEVDHFYTPIYNGSIVSSKLRSISGKAYSALCQNKTAQQEIDLAHANNPSTDILWETELYADIQLIQWLLVLISKSLDSASKFGEGRRGQASAASSMLGTGTMDSKGLFWGSNTTTYGVKVFGMENFWGNQWRRYEGHVMVNGVQKIKLTYGQEDGSSTNGYNTTGNGYLTADETAPSGTSGGYLSQMLFTNKGSVPQVANGSSTTYFCDGLWFNNSDTRVALRGGYANYGAAVGLFCCYLSYTASYAYWNIGASVSYKPLAR